MLTSPQLGEYMFRCQLLTGKNKPLTGKKKLDREKWETLKLTGKNGKLMKLTGKNEKVCY